jgi:hypothetical protein
MPIIIKQNFLPPYLSLSPDTIGQQTAKAPGLFLCVNVGPVSLQVGIYLQTSGSSSGTGSSFASGYTSFLSK